MYPLSDMIGDEKRYDFWIFSSQTDISYRALLIIGNRIGSTMGANLVRCAATIAVLDILVEENCLPVLVKWGPSLRRHLSCLATVCCEV
jgi:hypothetical protein